MSSYDDMRLPNGGGEVCDADSPPRKRHRTSANCTSGVHNITAVVDPEERRRRALEHKMLRARTVRDRATDLLCELYFLQAGGNMMDYAVWRKRPHAPALRAFLDARRPPPIEPASATASAASVDEGAPAAGGAAERARQEASVTRRAAALAAVGLWGAGRLPRVLEPPRPKAHRDYLLEEMAWLAADFAGERRWKQAAARRVARQCARAAVARAAAEERAARAAESARRRIAAAMAREVRGFWAAAEKLSRWTRARRHAARRKALLDRQLVDMVGRTERYSRQLAATLRASRTDHERPEEPDTPDTAPPTDEEFSPSSASSDDEETIAAADAEAGDTLDELEALRKESALELSDVLAALPPGYLSEAEREKPREENLELRLSCRSPVTAPAQALAAPLRTPGLLRHALREYQREGLQWLATMHARNLNGVLADEMGLGKTIQTIALLALLAERGDWGPHLVVAPTSVVVNWEMELKKWCPALKVLTYLGSIKERKHKRRGWTKPNSFHVCVTSYKLVVQDHQSFRRKRWNYLILDEAQNIKNFKSQRWQLLLNFQTERRLLLTGTPLQNSLLELWSLMHFLMPGVFASHSEFREWFAPVADDAGSEPLARRLHALLRPFLLRRLKRDVERQLPSKRERVVMCRLSKRQRCLYDDFLSRAKTRDALAGGRLPAVVDVLMQLRKVCNHPDLLEPRAAQAPLRFAALALRLPATVLLDPPPIPGPRLTALETLGAVPAARSRHLLAAPRDAPHAARPPPPAARLRLHLRLAPRPLPPAHPAPPPLPPAPPPTPPLAATPPGESAAPPERDADEWCSRSSAVLNARRAARLRSMAFSNERRASVLPLLGADLRAAVGTRVPPAPAPLPSRVESESRAAAERLAAAVGGAIAAGPVLFVGAGASAWRARLDRAERELSEAAAPLLRMAPGPRVLVPHPRLLQYDCGKLQTLAPLLRRLRAAGHRALLFSQMTRTLDVLEAFLCMHGLAYLRLDGATKAERRQALVDRFNRDPRVFAMLLSTRSGGVGLNLTGADTVLFYDSDWNPTMDAQAMDRAHRIGQTRDVHVYRLVSAGTVEENILRKAEQKRALGHRAIEAGRFTAAGIRELLGGAADGGPAESDEREDIETALAAAEDEADAAAARRAQTENDADVAEFDETMDALAKEPEEDPELHRLMDQLSGVEKYAMRVLARSESAAEEEAQAAEELRLQREQWSARSMPPPVPRSASPAVLTYAASPQVWVNIGGGEIMPMWSPPTPPGSATDVRIDICCLYRAGAAPDHSLPALTRARPHARPRRAARSLAPSGLFERSARAGGAPRTPRSRPVPNPSAAQHEWSWREDALLRRALRLQRAAGAQPVNWEWCAETCGRAARACRERAEAAAAGSAVKRRRRTVGPDWPRLEALHAALERRRGLPRRRATSPLASNPAHEELLLSAGIALQSPPSPMEVAARRAERLARLKQGGQGAPSPAAQRVVVAGPAVVKGSASAGSAATTATTAVGALYRQQLARQQQMKILQQVRAASSGTLPGRGVPVRAPQPSRAPHVVVAHLQQQQQQQQQQPQQQPPPPPADRQ